MTAVMPCGGKIENYNTTYHQLHDQTCEGCKRTRLASSIAREVMSAEEVTKLMLVPQEKFGGMTGNAMAALSWEGLCRLCRIIGQSID